MKFNDKTGTDDKLTIIHTRNGHVIDKRTPIVDASFFERIFGIFTGKSFTTDLITNGFKANAALNDTTQFTHMAIGTGTTAPAATETTLVTEALREAVTSERVTTTVTNDTARFTAQFTIPAPYTIESTLAITEIGLFDADTDGLMANRQVFPVINTIENDVITFIIDIVHA